MTDKDAKKQEEVTQAKTKKLFASLSEPMQNKNSYFISDEFNFDTEQSLAMEYNKEKMMNKVESSRINNQEMGSINDAKDYLGCVNDSCSKIEEHDQQSSNKNEKKSIQDYIFSNLGEKKNGTKNGTKNETKNEKEKNNKIYSILRENIDVMISFLYIFCITLLLFSTVLRRNSNYLMQIIILTLMYVFYRIYIAYRK